MLRTSEGSNRSRKAWAQQSARACSRDQVLKPHQVKVWGHRVFLGENELPSWDQSMIGPIQPVKPWLRVLGGFLGLVGFSLGMLLTFPFFFAFAWLQVGVPLMFASFRQGRELPGVMIVVAVALVLGSLFGGAAGGRVWLSFLRREGLIGGHRRADIPEWFVWPARLNLVLWPALGCAFAISLLMTAGLWLSGGSELVHKIWTKLPSPPGFLGVLCMLAGGIPGMFCGMKLAKRLQDVP